MRIIAPEKGQYVFTIYIRLVLWRSCAKPEPMFPTLTYFVEIGARGGRL